METTAEQYVKKKNPRRVRVLPLVVSGMLALMAFFLKFCIPGYSFSALVCVCLIGITLFYEITRLLKHRFPKCMKYLRRVFTVCLCTGLLVVSITEAIIIKHSFGDPGESCQYMVVLGAKVREDGPSVSLMDRIRGAYEYMVAHPDVIAIVSGGQGEDEPMSEAQCMYDHLVAMGIDESRIWIEDQATSTWGNLNLSLDLIEARTGTRPEKIGLLSSENHLFRAGLQAKECGVETVGIPARTSRFSQKVNHFMREVAGVWHYLLLGGQYD